ncbi:MAG: hypothetical protein OEZ22_00460 [Spirochaetia bacterium]|nr:hypothetical protein [Spirochaetia bacterium]
MSKEYQNILRHINNLFEDPKKAWMVIDSEYYRSYKKLMFYYMTPFFFLLTFTIVLSQLFLTENIIKRVFFSLLISILSFGSYCFLLYILSIITEYTVEIMGGKNKPLAGAKLSLFSSLPFLSLIFISLIIVNIPYLRYAAYLIAVTGILYNIKLISSGAEQLLMLPNGRKVYWGLIIITTILISLIIISIVGLLIYSIYLNII